MVNCKSITSSKLSKYALQDHEDIIVVISNFLFSTDPTRPPNITAHNTSSTSVSVQWHKIPSPLVKGYNIMHREVGFNSAPVNQTVEYHTDTLELSSLKKFTNYSVRLQTFVWCLDGLVSSPIYVITDEDSKSQYQPRNLVFSRLVHLVSAKL